MDSSITKLIVGRPWALVTRLLRRKPRAPLLPVLFGRFGRRAVPVTIDDFTAAVATKQPPGVIRSTLGSTTVVESSLAGVIGGVRQLTVAMTFAATPADYIMAGASPDFATLDYAASAGADGRFELLYDTGGAGLNVDFSSATGIRVAVTAADADCLPYVVTVILSDSTLRSASSSQTIAASGPCRIDFPLWIFGAVDITRIFSVRIIVDANTAPGLQLGRIEALRTAPPAATTNPSATTSDLTGGGHGQLADPGFGAAHRKRRVGTGAICSLAPCFIPRTVWVNRMNFVDRAVRH